jgi:hypothetical protein
VAFRDTGGERASPDLLHGVIERVLAQREAAARDAGGSSPPAV